MNVSGIKLHLPLCFALLVLWGAISFLLFSSISQTGGQLVYVLDDPYIHMAMAEQFVNHGVWGVTQYGFSSSSSSVLWPLLLSISYALFGTNTLTPFILNVVLASASVCLAYLIFYKHKVPALFSMAMLILIIFVAPMPDLVFTGLEHLLHIFFALLFIYFAPSVLLSDARSQERFFSRDMIMLLISSIGLCLSRYEGLFMLLALCVLFVIRRKILHAVVLGVLSVAPIVIYGAISVANGSYFLPNSLLLKSSASNITSIGDVFGLIGDFGISQLIGTDHLFLLAAPSILLIVSAFIRTKQLWTPSSIIVSIFVASSLMHLRFAQLGTFFRYEAYLVVLGLVALTCAYTDFMNQSEQPQVVSRRPLPYAMAGLLGLILLAPPFSFRAWLAFIKTPQASVNIYEQQYQMATFLNEYYTGQGVAANDIGYISYKADIRLLDLWGLASIQVAQAKRSGTYDTAMIERLAQEHNVKIALVYTSWYERYGGLPHNWEKVGSWTVSNNIVLGDTTVSFYAVDKTEAQKLKANLNSFATQLPAGVQVNADLQSQEASAP